MEIFHNFLEKYEIFRAHNTTADKKEPASINCLTSGDVVDSKKSDANVTVDVPLLRLTVWLTAVVHETRVITFWTSVDDPRNIPDVSTL